MPIAKRIGTILLLIALWIGTGASPAVAAGDHSFSIHHPGGSAGAGAVFRVWRVSEADSAKGRDALGEELSALSTAQLNARYPGGFDTDPADAQGIALVTGLQEGRYYIRPKQTGEKLQYFLVDLPEIRNGIVYTHVDAYPKETDAETDGEIVVLKRDGNTQKPLVGVVFDLYSVHPQTEARSLVYKGLATGADGRIRIAGVSGGDYILVETKALPGYAPIGERRFRLADGETIEIVIENHKKPETGDHEFIKTDADDPLRVLPGASFKVTQKEIRDGKEVYTTVQRNGGDYIVTSGPDGRFTVTDLPYGTYYLWETTVPKQPDKVYEPLGVPIAFTISEKTSSSSPVRVVPNRGKPEEPPETEPPGTEPPQTEPPAVPGTEPKPPVPQPQPPKPPKPTTPSKPVVPSTGDTVQFLWMGSGLTMGLIGLVLVLRKNENVA